MMANMPMLQDLAAGLLNGAARPAVPIQGEGVDFAALLAGADPARAQNPGEATVAVGSGPDFAAVMPDRPVSPETGQAVVESRPAGAATLAPPMEALPSGSTPVTQLLARIEALPKSPPPHALGPERQARPSAPARLASMASALPQMAMALQGENTGATVETDIPAPVEQDFAPEGRPSLLEDPAQPVREAPPPADMPAPQAILTSGAPAALARAAPNPAAPAASRSPAIAAAIQSAAQSPTPQIRASAAEKPSTGRPAPAPGPNAAPIAAQASSRQAIALELAAASLVQGRAGEAVPSAPKADPADSPAAPAPISAAPLPGIATLSPLAPVTGLETALPPMEGAAPLGPVIPAADTAAMLGEQVVDMGVEGQWIDRMAREITQIAAGTGRASFTLTPEHLGRLQVEILQHDAGADVRLIAETDDAAAALNQGRQQLQQDARLQAVRINDVQVERAPADRAGDATPSARAGAAGQDLPGQQGQSQPSPKKPLIEAVSSSVTLDELDQAASERTGGQNARYA